MQSMPAKLACAKRRYEITQADLPLSCPTKDMTLWNAHPRVYLPIEKNGGHLSHQAVVETVAPIFFSNQ